VRKLPSSWSVFDLANKQKKVAELEELSSSPTFWDDPNAAQAVMQQQSRLRDEIERWQGTAKRLDDALELASLGDAELLEDLSQETDQLTELVEKMSFQTMMGGKYDSENAMIAIHAGAGGVDAQDWAAMLLRMYLRWGERRGFKTDIVDEMPGDEAGIKSVTISFEGDHVYGYLQSERGVHRLVRLSPFDSASRRHTSFALVESWPDIQGEIEFEINPVDLQIDTYRSAGAGGQHVQKNETAIRITHLPSGLVVSCQNQRSQLQNRMRAMQVLKSRLLELERLKQEAEFSELKGDHISAAWGNQIRSYVLHPYQMVKDLRTDQETSQTGKVLDGDLDAFMEAYLRYKVGEKS
jgi:peptide chain release factor 2